jgi:Carboxypeptidase regulatory-like domain/TonB-dependent Receptor Plug Domain
MSRWILVLSIMLTAARPAAGQLQGGSVVGTAADQTSAMLPGVTVTMRGADATYTAVTDGQGRFRFLNLAPGTYVLTASLSGFTTVIHERVVVEVGKHVEIPLAMKLAPQNETVTVSADSPVVDPRATGTSTNFTADELTKIPTSRDPFALMRAVPGVLVDRVNIAGNETGQQSNFVSKATRPADAVWTMDGVNITDMAATGASPTYFNYDNFEEVQVATAGQSIKQPTGGVGVNLIVKRGTNRWQGSARGYFTNDALEASNVPAELRAAGVTPETADHNEQISDYGYEVGGPLLQDRAWLYHSYSRQDIRLVRRAGQLVDRTVLTNPNVKVNWQASSRAMVNFLFFDGIKVKDGRSPAISGILFDAPTATWHQDNAYADDPFHGLWKIGADLTVGRQMFLSAKYAYYNTGFILDPEGGMSIPAGRSFVTAQSFGSLNRQEFQRPQKTVNADVTRVFSALRGTHDLAFGFGYRTVEARSLNQWPGNGILGLEFTPTDLRAQVFRTGGGGDRANYVDLYVGDTYSKGRATVDAGVKYDIQWGKSLPSATAPNPAFPELVPGIRFDGYRTPFTWKDVSPRAGLTFALDSSRKTLARASISRYAGQMSIGNVGFRNPTAASGFAFYRWVDANGDHLAQAAEVRTDEFLSAGNGFNPADPTAVTSPNVFASDLRAPRTTSLVAGIDRELSPGVALHAAYSYTRTTGVLGVSTPRVGVTRADYLPGPTLTGVLPDNQVYTIATFIPDPARVAAGGNGFVLDNWDGFSTAYNGVEMGLTRRLAHRWMARVTLAINDARAHYTDQALRNATGNPTGSVAVPLRDEGQFAPQSAGSGAGTIYVNAKWQFNASGLYEAPFGLELSASVFGRQGYPFLPYRSQSLGADTGVQVLVAPEVDTFRYPALWNADVRVARTLSAGRVRIRLIGDVFNIMNANTALVRNNNITSPTFNALAQNLSPRIFRVGASIGF